MKFLVYLILIIVLGCTPRSEISLEENAKAMAEKYKSANYSSSIVHVMSPDSLVTIVLTKGEWYGSEIKCNYVIEKKDTLFISNRNRLITKIKNNNYVVFIKD